MGRMIILPVIVLLTALELQAQAPPQTAQPKAAPDINQLAVNWVDRLNGLSKWYLAPDGNEDGVNEVVDQMMELFAPDVLAQVPPHDEEQIGPVVLFGSEQLRKWVDKIARTQVDIKFKIQRQTEQASDGELMVHSKPLPWGGISVAFQVHGAYSLRVHRERFLELGSVFLQYREDGKIQRLRLILAEKELVVDRVDDEL